MQLASLDLKKQDGLGLIEALITLLVISIGLLGIAALQLSAMQQTASSHWHSQAVWYSYEITDRIGANRTAFADYAGIDTSGSYTQDCESGPCTNAQMVTADAQDWKAMVESLPEGRGVVSANADGSLMVSVMWRGAEGESNCTNGEDNPDGRTCYTVTVR